MPCARIAFSYTHSSSAGLHTLCIFSWQTPQTSLRPTAAQRLGGRAGAAAVEAPLVLSAVEAEEAAGATAGLGGAGSKAASQSALLINHPRVRCCKTSEIRIQRTTETTCAVLGTHHGDLVVLQRHRVMPVEVAVKLGLLREPQPALVTALFAGVKHAHQCTRVCSVVCSAKHWPST